MNLMEKMWLIGIFVILLIFVNGCQGIDLSDVSDEDIEKVTDKTIICNAPYMRQGMDCCLDANSNSICDDDEKSGLPVMNESKSVEEELDVELSNDSYALSDSLIDNRSENYSNKYPESKLFSEVKGRIDSDVTWTKKESPYLVTGSVLVEKGHIFVIEQGVEIFFDNCYYIQVDGQLKVLGTEKEKVYFMPSTGHSGKNEKHYGKLIIGKESSNSLIQHAVFSNNGCGVNSRETILVYGENTRIQDSIFENGMDNAIIWQGLKGEISDNQIINYGSSAIQISSGDLEVYRNELINNNGDGISIIGSVAGIKGPTVKIVGNNIRSNKEGIVIRGRDEEENMDLIIEDNNICQNKNGIHIRGISLPRIIGNNMFNNKEYNLRQTPYGQNTLENTILNCSGNYWGLFNADEIKQTILDEDEDFNLVRIEISPFLIKPSITAPLLTYC